MRSLKIWLTRNKYIAFSAFYEGEFHKLFKTNTLFFLLHSVKVEIKKSLRTIVLRAIYTKFSQASSHAILPFNGCVCFCSLYPHDPNTIKVR